MLRYDHQVGRERVRDMGDKTVESELFSDVAASNDGFLEWFGTIESYDKFIDVVNGCTISYGGIIK